MSGPDEGDSSDGGGTWERGWDGHERAQARRRAGLSLAEKLDWLEEAQRLVEALRPRRHH